MQNFGIINETFKNILVDSIAMKDGKGKRMFSKYVKALKENKVFRAQYHVYNSIENKVEADRYKSSEYINESINLLKKLGKNTIITENTKLLNFLVKNGYSVYDGDYLHKTLHENINTLVSINKSFKTLDSIVEASHYVNSFINENVSVIKDTTEIVTFPNKTVKAIWEAKFNERYSDLSVIENSIIKSVMEGNVEAQKSIYTELVDSCLESINTNLLECTIDEKDKLLQVKDKLLRFTYNENTFVSEISKINSLKSSLI
jgi:hypothetical protein